jgi:hypothetical protein
MPVGPLASVSSSNNQPLLKDCHSSFTRFDSIKVKTDQPTIKNKQLHLWRLSSIRDTNYPHLLQKEASHKTSRVLT